MKEKIINSRVITDLLKVLSPEELKAFDRHIIRFFRLGEYVGLACFITELQYNGSKDLVVSHVAGNIENFSYEIEKTLVDLAKKLKCSSIRMHTEDSNKAMRALYARLKFTPDEIIYTRKV